MKRIYFTVTNDLSFDQRMHRICGSVADAGFEVVLVGRKLSNSYPLQKKNFAQERLRCFFNKGFLFYAEYNLRLFFFLLLKRMDGVCAIDLDTILPCLFVSGLKKIPRIYDAHEFFTEMKEVRTRPRVQKIWLSIERFAVPRFKYGYTVSESLAEEFNQRYKKNFITVRNLPVLRPLEPVAKAKFLLAQGAVNEARAFEYLIPAMQRLNYKLVVCGDGNFMPQLKKMIEALGLQEKIELKGMLLPDELWPVTQAAALGLGLADREGTHQFLALPNKFFDYMHAGTPQLAMAYPEYEKINKQYKVAVLIDDLSEEKIAEMINRIMDDQQLLDELRENCLKARLVLNWEAESKTLIEFYQSIFGSAQKNEPGKSVKIE